MSTGLPNLGKRFKYMEGWVKFKFPRSPRLCLLGNRGEVPELEKAGFSVKHWACDLCSSYFNTLDRASDPIPEKVEGEND